MADETKTYSQADIDALTQKLHNAVAKAEDASRRVEELSKIDPEEVKRLKYELDGYKQKDAQTSPEKLKELIAAKEAEIRQAIQGELDKYKGDNEKLAGRLKEREVVDEVFKVASSKFVDHAFEDVKDYARRYCETDKEGKIVFKDEKGQPRYKKGSTAILAGADDFVEWLTEAKPHWAKAPGGTGGRDAGDRSSSTSTGKVLTAEQLEGMTREQLDKIPLEDLKAIKF